MSFNRPAPPPIPHSRFIRLCLSGLFRPTKRPQKRRHRIDQKQHQPSQTAKLCLLNARSIVNKIEALNELVLDGQPDILAITETWLTPKNGDHELAACCPSGFSGVHQPRASRRGGGVAAIFKWTISVRRHSHPPFNSFELIDCSLSFRPRAIRLLVIYRPLASSYSVFRNEFSSLLEQIALSNEKLLIVGDFNLSI
jgi:hypothetical protein